MVAGGAIAALVATAGTAEAKEPSREDLQKMMAVALKEAYEEEIGQNFHALLSRRVNNSAMNRFVTACELVTRTYLDAWKKLIQTNVPH